MRNPLAVAVLAGLVATPLPGQAQDAPPSGFDVQELAPGVYATIRREPPGLFFESNNVFVVNEADVVVVDANITPDSTRRTIAALKAITAKPVRYVVNTHWHDDHIVGNSAWRDAYPGVEFVGHRSAPADFATIQAENRKQLLEHGPGFAAELRRRLEAGESAAGGPMGEAERASLASDVAQAGRYFAAAPGFELVPPSLLVDDRLTLQRGPRRIDVLWLGRAHTAADLVVHLPAEGILVAGDLVDHPVPLIGSTSYPLDYAATLERMLALPHTTIVPGHGPVLRDDAYVRQVVALLRFLEAQARAALARGETLEQAQASIDWTAQRKLFTGDVVPLRVAFASYVREAGLAAAWRQLTAPRP